MSASASSSQRSLRAATIALYALTAIAVALNLFNFRALSFDIEFPNYVAYIAQLVLLGFVLTLSRKYRFSLVICAIPVVCAVSLMVNGSAHMAESLSRVGLMAAMLALFSPMVQSDALTEAREVYWRMLIAFLWALLAVSVVYYPFWLHDNLGSYKSITLHGNYFGALMAIVAIDSGWRLTYRRLTHAWLAVHSLIAVAAAFMTVASGSRCAIAGLAVAAAFALVMQIGRWRRMGAVAAYLAVVVGLVLALSHVSLAGVRVKNEKAEAHGSILYSRAELWEARVDEFKESPVIGIGYDNARYFSKSFDRVDEQTGRLERSEPGSSWLMALSNIGTVGFLLLLAVNVLLAVRLYRGLRAADSRAVLLAALWLMLTVDSLFEGWMLYAGSTLFNIYWLTAAFICLLPPRPISASAGS